VLRQTYMFRHLYLYANIHSFGYMPRSDIAGSYSSSIFSFLRNLHTVFYSGCSNLHSCRQSTRAPILLHPCQHLLLLVFLVVATLTRARWNLSVVLTCISFVVKGVEHFCIYWPFVLLWRTVCSIDLPTY
jgi:hypothetical protein